MEESILYFILIIVFLLLGMIMSLFTPYKSLALLCSFVGLIMFGKFLISGEKNDT